MPTYWLVPNPVRKLASHPELAPGEEVRIACFGLGSKMLGAADAAAAVTDPTPASRPPDPGYAAERRAADAAPGEFARAMGGSNGYLGITDRRLVFGRTASNWKRPKHIDASCPLDDVEDVSYDKPILRVRFRDGSTASLHVPRAQRPDLVVETFGGRK